MRLMQIARLSAAGELAATLAHELNQPLGAIGNYLAALEQALRRDGGGPDALDLVRKAAAQTLRASEIVGRVRRSVARGEVAAREESLLSLVREAIDVALAGGLLDGVAIQYDLDRTLDGVCVDRIQIQQVVLNLVRNAAEAMAAGPRRELSIGSRPAEDPGFLALHIADTGPGVSPDLARRLFQPFVSGKPGGIGLGLCISRSIIESHGGRLWTTSNIDGGATFHLTLPVETAA